MKELLVAVCLFASLNAALAPEVQTQKIEDEIRAQFKGKEVNIIGKEGGYFVETVDGKERYSAVVNYLPGSEKFGPQQFTVTIQEE